jgi:hypothetical protein
MSITVKAAREALEAAHATYIQCDHEDIASAKETLDNARHTFWNTCAAFCTSLEFKHSLSEVESELVTQGLWT